jgi:hypothetical protein
MFASSLRSRGSGPKSLAMAAMGTLRIVMSSRPMSFDAGMSSSMISTPPGVHSRMSSTAVASLHAIVRSRRPLADFHPRSLRRTRYQVGRPAMLLGKRFFGATGTPMRKMVFAMIVLEEALPEPFTVATAMVKSLMTGEAMQRCLCALPPGHGCGGERSILERPGKSGAAKAE